MSVAALTGREDRRQGKQSNMTQPSLSNGLRCVLAYVFNDGSGASNKSATLDMAVIQIANAAMKRKLKWGVDDAFLFVIVGQTQSDVFADRLIAHGFPRESVECIQIDDSGLDETDFDQISLLTASTIQAWVMEKHQGAIAYFSQEYAAIDYWWSGIESDGQELDYPFEPNEFSVALPTTHLFKSATWLSILAQAVELAALQGKSPHALGQDIAASYAATLCEWLHGFEAATENSYNHFKCKYNPGLYPSDVFLGYELARLVDCELQDCCDDFEIDIDELPKAAINAIASSRRGELRDALSQFFGGDGALLWALYSAIWPNFERAMADSLLVELSTDVMPRLESPWQFISEGWCDLADNH